MSVFNFEKIEELLAEYFGDKYKISNYSDCDLGTAYSSEHIRKLNFTVRGLKKFGKDEIEMEAVAKLLLGADLCSDTSYSKAAMKKEIDFYKTVLAKLQDFQRQYDIEPFSGCPEYLGSRLSLTGGKEIDQDSALLLQNLWGSGFTQADLQKGLDLAIVKMVLENLAEFHAIPIVMNQRKPMEFTKYVKSKCTELPKSQFIDIEKYSKDVFYEKLYENNGCLPYIKNLKQGLKDHKPPFIVNPEEPFSTVIHNDLWSKNIFIQYDEEKPKKVAFIDFKHYIYGSPASDVLYLLLSSADNTVLEHHFQEMIKFYYDRLIKNLEKYNIELAPFGYNKFIEQVKSAAKPTLFRAIFFLLENIYVEKNLASLSLEAKQRIWIAVQQVGGHGWL